MAAFPEREQTVAVFSLEMSRESLLTRMICGMGVNLNIVAPEHAAALLRDA